MIAPRLPDIRPAGDRRKLDAATHAALRARVLAQRAGPVPADRQRLGTGLHRTIDIASFGARITTTDIVVFTRQLGTMIDAGLPIVRSLSILAHQATNKKFGAVVQQLKEDVESGSTLTQTLRKHPKMFDDLFVNMIAAGEGSGLLDTILQRLAAHMEKSRKLRAKITGAMLYPAAIVTVAAGVTTVLLVWVIPIFGELFASFGQALPAPTEFVIELSNFTIAYFLYLVVAVVAFGLVLARAYQAESGRLAMEQLLLKLPVVGDLMRKSSIARFARTLGALLSSGVPLLDALPITAKTSGNKLVEQTILAARARLSEGTSIAEPLMASAVFPPMVCQMIAVGESTGTLDTMLLKIAEFYEDEVEALVANLTTLMEPLIIVVLGIVVGGLVISMYLPIFNLGAVIG